MQNAKGKMQKAASACSPMPLVLHFDSCILHYELEVQTHAALELTRRLHRGRRQPCRSKRVVRVQHDVGVERVEYVEAEVQAAAPELHQLGEAHVEQIDSITIHLPGLEEIDGHVRGA